MRGDVLPLGCVTGRFQPLHEQHLELIEMALAECEHVIVAITNPDTGARHREETSTHRHTSEANPFLYFERVRLIAAAVRARAWTERISIVPFNLTRPEFWPQYVPQTARQYVRAFAAWERQKAELFHQHGYEVRLIDGDIAHRLSASDIRSSMLANDDRWREMVPTATRALLVDMLADCNMEKRI